MGAAEMTTPQNKIEIFGPKSDGSYWLEHRQSDGQSLVVSVPASEAAVLKYFSGPDAVRLGASR